MKASTKTTTRTRSSRVAADAGRASAPARAKVPAPPKGIQRATGSATSKTEMRARRPKQHTSPMVDMADVETAKARVPAVRVPRSGVDRLQHRVTPIPELADGAGASIAESTPVVSAVPGAVLDRLAALVVERTQLLQAELRLNNQIKANERLLTGGRRGIDAQEVRAADGDPVEGDTQLPAVPGHQHLDTLDVSAALAGDQHHDDAQLLDADAGAGRATQAAARAPFATLALRQVRATLHAERLRFERRLTAEAKLLPVWPWVESVRGVGPLLLALIAGDSGDLATYANPAKLWKRWGLAVIDGRAQRRVTDPEQAAIHGFNPRRRATMHVLGECLMKAGSPRYRPLYDARKAYELERLPADAKARKLWAHKRALRYIEKRFLLDLWRAWITAAPVQASA